MSNIINVVSVGFVIYIISLVVYVRKIIALKRKIGTREELSLYRQMARKYYHILFFIGGMYLLTTVSYFMIKYG